MSHVILNQIEIPWLKFNFSKDDDANHLWALHFSSDAQLCPTLCDPMDCIMPGFPVLHQLLELLKFMSIKLVMPSNHLMLCCPVLLLPSIFPSIRVISRESLILIRWPKYWSFSFSISPSNEYSGLISFRTSLVVQMVKCLPTMQETQVQSQGWEDLLEKEMATHSTILAWKIL